MECSGIYDDVKEFVALEKIEEMRDLHCPNKPPLGVELNTSHPLAKGLVGVLILNEGVV